MTQDTRGSHLVFGLWKVPRTEYTSDCHIEILDFDRVVRSKAICWGR